MTTNILRSSNPVQLSLIALVSCLAILTIGQTKAEAIVGPEATTTNSIFLQVSKVLSPAHFPGTLDEEDFNFHISGPGGSWSIPHAGTVELGVGQYDITESYIGSDPIGFVPTDWTVYWAGDLCEGPADVPAEAAGTIIVTESDLGRFTDQNPARCNAENQYKPEDGGGGGNGGGAATLKVVKVVMGTSTPPNEFAFSINGAPAIPFEVGGVNEIKMATGTYEVLEVGTTSDYAVSYSSDCSDLVLAVDDVATCTITNTWKGNNGGGNGGSDEYRIEGFVWHDVDKNGEKVEDESYLEGWVVAITNGSTTATTTTSDIGHYSFVVEAGTWIVSESLPEGWSRSFPSSEDGTYVITVPQEEEEESVFVSFLDWFTKTAEAAIVDTYSGYNFGNYQGGNGGGGGNNNGGSNSGGSRSGGGGRSGQNEGIPQVLGTQVSVIPEGAVQGGHGGSSLDLPSALTPLWPIFAWFGF